MTAPCEFCEAPFEPIPFSLPGPGGTLLEVKTTACPACSKVKAFKTPASLAPSPVPDVTVRCMMCGNNFTAEAVVFPGDGKHLKDVVSHATVCDSCADKAPSPPPPPPSREDRLRASWTGMVGTRYAEFCYSELPEAIQGHAERVLAWTPQPRGIGLVGPSRTGKSPLLYGLAQRLHMAGVDVFPTSGITFQREYLRAFGDERAAWESYLNRCEWSDVLLIDDADKLNLTAGVEAEYYGMLETRRNWMRPVLCTLNLTGAEIAAMGRDRSDRSAAIVERLRDLCEFIPVS